MLLFLKIKKMNYKKQYLILVEPVPEEVDKVWGVLMFSLKKEFPNDESRPSKPTAVGRIGRKKIG